MKKYIKMLIAAAIMMTLITPSAWTLSVLAAEDHITPVEEICENDSSPAAVTDADAEKTAGAEEARTVKEANKNDVKAENDGDKASAPDDKGGGKPAAAPSAGSNDSKSGKAENAQKTGAEDTGGKGAAEAVKKVDDDRGKYLPYTLGKCTEDPIAALERSLMTQESRIKLSAAGLKSTGLTPGQKTTYKSTEVDEASIFTAGGLKGFCGDIGKPRGVNGEAEVSLLSNKSKAARLMYYYCVKKGWWEKANGEDKGERQSSLNGMYRMVFIERMVQYAYQGSDSIAVMKKYYADSTIDLIKDKANDAFSAVDEAPAGFRAYLLEDDSKSVQSKILMWDYSETSKLKIRKAAAGQTSNSLAGAVYYIYTNSACTIRANDANGKQIELRTNDKGESNEAEVGAGTYYVKEISAPSGFELDTAVHTVEVKAGQTAVVNSTEPLSPFACLQKQAAATTTDFISAAPGNYTLQNAEYELFTDSACTIHAKDVKGSNITLRTKANGSTDSVQVHPGTYYAKEKTASKGFMLDTTVRGPVTVTASNTASNPAKIVSIEEPAFGDLFRLRKIDKSGKNGWKKLIGAKYKISWYAADPDTENVSGQAARSWTFATVKKTDPAIKETYAGIDFMEDTPVSGDDFFVGENGKRILPIGVFTLEEIEAPAGIARDEIVYYGKVYQPNNGADAKTEVNTGKGEDLTFEVGSETDVVNHEKPQSVKIVIDKKSGKTEGNVPDGTDRDHVQGSLAGAEFDVYYDDPGQTKPVKVGTIVTDELGHGELTADAAGEELELGRYFVEERIAPPGYVIDSITTPEKKGVYEDGKHIINARALEKNTGVFEFTVTSKDKPHETHIYKKDIVTGEEVPGATLQVFDSAGDKLDEWTSTNEPHDIIALHDETQGSLKDGKYILREITAPFGYDLAEDVEFLVKSGEVENKVEMNNAPITFHTNATDAETGTHTGTFSKEEKIIDRVTFENLYAGREYTFKGTLMDKDTKEPLKDKDGNEVTAERTCKFDENGNILEGEYTGPEGVLVSGSVDMEFTVDASEFTKEKSVVAFEDLYREENKIAMHADLSDKNQTITYGGIVRTVAADKKSGSHNVLAGKDTVVIDTVEYKNLAEGGTYTVDGVIYDKTTGSLTNIKGTKTFTAKAADGKVEVEFRFDASGMKNHDLVVYETLRSNGAVIDKHENPDDEDQTIHVPDIRTTASDVKTGDHIGFCDKIVMVKDVVVYSNLIPGKEYVMSGTLMNKRTGKPVMTNGAAVTASKKFTPASKDGSVEIIFPFNGDDLRGETVVAFEECKTTGVSVAVHADINDEEQSVKIPKIGTKANLAKAHKAVFDLVTYENLRPGRYIMRGWLMNKKTGKMVEGSEGETEFTVPEKGPYAGAVTVDLPVKNYDKSGGNKLVAYEELYWIVPGTDDEEEREELVADHKDLDDRDQTVTIPGRETPKTGDNNLLKVYGIITVMASAELILIYAGRRRSGRRSRRY